MRFYYRADVKLLLRCKLLSKSYYNLITSPSFVSKHLHQSTISRNKNNDNIVVILNHAPKKAVRRNNYLGSAESFKDIVYLLSPESELHLPPVLDPNSISIFGSCNGLLLVQGNSEKFLSLLYLCNPSTREYKPIPPQNPRAGHFGFGHDAATGVSKVVMIYKKIRRVGRSFVSEIALKLWSSRRNIWVQVRSDFPKNLRGLNVVRPGVLVKGNLYWLLESKDKQFLFCFELGDNTSGEITTSDVVSQYVRCRMDVTELMGALLLFVEDVSSPSSSYGWHDIWVMKNNELEVNWIKHLRIKPYVERFQDTRVCDKWKFGTLVGSKFSRYGPPSNELMRLHLPDPKFGLWSFVRSLVPVKQSSGHGRNENVS